MTAMRAAAPLALAALAACGGARLTPPSPVRVPLGTEFTLAVGQVAVVDDTGLRVSFDAVGSDSRCPAGVQCVWEGDAALALAVEGPAGGASYELHTSAQGPHDVTHAGYRIALVRLEPQPRPGPPPARSDYRATLVVVRARP